MLSEIEVKTVILRILRELYGIPQDRKYPPRLQRDSDVGKEIGFNRPPDHVIKIPEVFWGKSKIDQLEVWYDHEQNRTYWVLYVGPDGDRHAATTWNNNTMTPEEILEDHLVEILYHQYRMSYMEH